MDCETARYLIDPLHDDELDVASAAALVGHLEGCGSCRTEEARILSRRSSLATLRPGTCPAELRRRIAASCGGGSERGVLRRRGGRSAKGRFAWPLLFVSVAGVVAGAVLTRTGALPLRAGRYLSAEPGGFPLQELVAPHDRAQAAEPMEVEGEVFCLKCALETSFPDTTYAKSEHVNVLRTGDGHLYVLLKSDAADGIAPPGCSARHVLLKARLYPRDSLADVVSVVSVTSSLRAGR
ncbi:MAG: zf-HC2 domain-containing protein [Acidobacteria bacterium]|nr:zf-HC2 domain-containing protein [Acidobacteriota bacterium]